MINFYDKVSKKDKSEAKLDKHFKNHYILPNSMKRIIGGTGSGKSNALLKFISKQIINILILLYLIQYQPMNLY